jgi:hypothetical protein
MVSSVKHALILLLFLSVALHEPGTRNALLSDNLALVLNLLILQDKHSIRRLLVNIKLICSRYETGQEKLDKAHFLTVSKARTNKLHVHLYFPTMYVYCIFSTIHYVRHKHLKVF